MEKCNHREMSFVDVNFTSKEAICKCLTCGHIFKLEGLQLEVPKEIEDDTITVEYRMNKED